MGSSRRSCERIDAADLWTLAEIAERDERALFARRPAGAGRYDGRLLCRALCQGAAKHYIDGVSGVKDFEVWSFYIELDSGPYPYRRVGKADYGRSKFGRSPDDSFQHRGRRVDLIGRSLRRFPGETPGSVLQRYLGQGKTKSARLLAQKAVVLIAPRALLGEVVWPLRSE